MRFFSLRVLGNRIKAITSMMKDKSVSIWKKLLVILGIIYVVFPLDALPFPTFPVSFLDDILVWVLIIFALRRTLDNYWFGGKVVDFSKKYNDKNVVEGVQFDVEDDSQEDSEESTPNEDNTDDEEKE